MEKLLVLSMDIRHEMFRPFRQIQHGLQIDDLCGSHRHAGIELRQAFQVFQFHFLFHMSLTPSKKRHTRRYSVFSVFIYAFASMTSLIS